MLIPSRNLNDSQGTTSLSRGTNANSQLWREREGAANKSIKRDEC